MNNTEKLLIIICKILIKDSPNALPKSKLALDKILDSNFFDQEFRDSWD